jgi:aarF domain-containing kinase
MVRCKRSFTDAISALPILRQLGAQSGSSMIRGGDFSMLKVWVGLEARSFLQASIDTV